VGKVPGDAVGQDDEEQEVHEDVEGAGRHEPRRDVIHTEPRGGGPARGR
jgi:hypothetical protein